MLEFKTIVRLLRLGVWVASIRLPIKHIGLLSILIMGGQLTSWSLAMGGGFLQPDANKYPDIFLWQDTCNVWILRDGESALLVDLGDGSVLSRLREIGVKNVEWILFTHHHREQCQGAALLNGTATKFAAPMAERRLLESPTSFRKMKVSLGDEYTIHGSSYVRPPIQPIKIDRAFEKMDTFSWRGYNFWCIDSRGHSPGAMSYMLRTDDRWIGFTGDAMLADARLHTWYDSEWDYGFGAGIWSLMNSAGQIAGYDPEWLLPSHGPGIHHPAEQLEEFQSKLLKLNQLYLRGYPVQTYSGAKQDPVSRPSQAAHVWKISNHLFKLRGPDYFPNFYMIIADSGHGLAVDCGVRKEVLDLAILGMRQHMGLKTVDAVFITHMHGDHMLAAPHMRERWGAEIWAIDRMADVCEHPEWFDYAAPVQAYQNGPTGVRLDRRFQDGEKLAWEGFDFTVDWMPGQTEFALGLQGVIDGQRVVFTGDNIFGDPNDLSQTGHEAVVAHNSSVLEEGYIRGAEYLSRLQPDLILGGHSYVMPKPKEFIERYRRWSYAMRDAFQDLLPQDDYRYGYDPFWVRTQPYRSTLAPGGDIELTIHVKNFTETQESHTIEVHTPEGLVARPSTLKSSIPSNSTHQHTVRIHADPSASSGLRIIALDITRGTSRLGELVDAIVEIIPK